MRKKLVLSMFLIVAMLITATPHTAPTAHYGKNSEVTRAPGFVFDHYPSYEEMNATIHNMSAYYSDIMTVFSIGKTYGLNPNTMKYDTPRDIWVVKISDNVNTFENATEPAIMINWHHAREWIGPVFILYLMQMLVENYNTNDTIHWIVDHFEIYFVPMTNADGYVFDGNGNPANLSGGVLYATGGWRKNARDNNGNRTFEVTDKWGATGEGVDLERNWDWYWANGNSDSSAADYRGPAPFSEPETAAERDFIINYDIDSYCVIHSFHGTVLIPWLYTAANAPHNAFYRSMAENMTKRTKIEGNASQHYDYGRPDETIGYSAPGGSPDWVYGTYNKIAIAVEMEPKNINYLLEDGFHPDTSKIATYLDDLYEGMMYFIKASSTNLKAPSEASNQPNPYIVWGHVKDSSGAPVINALVKIRDESTGETIYTYTDDNGYYMLNLGTLSNKYNTSTQFTIYTGDFVQSFTTDANGEKNIEITVTVVPEMTDYTAFVVIVLLIITLLLRKGDF